MKLTIPADDTIANTILDAKGLDLIFRHKLIYVHLLGNEKQKQFVKKVALRYADRQVQTSISVRLTERIEAMYNETRAKYDETSNQIHNEI